MSKSRFALAVCLVCVAFAGCAAQHQEDEAFCRSDKPGVITSVNRACVIVPDHPVDPAVTNAEWKGQQVGFCCNGCKPAWAKLTEAERDAKLAAALATKLAN